MFLSDTSKMLFQCVTCRKEDVLFQDPRMLDCGHLICLNCVQKEIVCGSILCPKCLGITMVPPNGVSQLNQGPVLKQLTELLSNAQQQCAVCRNPANYKCTQNCNKILCGNCLKESASIQCGHETKQTITMHCPIHQNFLISEYCSECNRLLCTRCITENTCSNPKINVRDTVKQHCQTKVPEEELLAKKERLQLLCKQLSDIENQVKDNTKQIIQMTLKTELVILQQIKQNKQATCEQLKSTNILLTQDLKSPHHYPIRSNGPAITLLMEKLQLQMLEACINSPTSKMIYTKGSIKPSKLIVCHENTIYDPATVDNRNLENIDSWEVNDAYEYVSTNGRRISATRKTDCFKEITWTKNDFYVKVDTSCNCGNSCCFYDNVNASKPTEINWIKCDSYITADKACKCEDHGLSETTNAAANGVQDCSLANALMTLNTSPENHAKRNPPKVPPKPKQFPWKLQFENPSQPGFDEFESAPTPRLDPNFIKFAEMAEDYNYVEDFMPESYTAIDLIYPPQELKNWTKDASRIIVTSDGETVLSYHTGSSTQIWSFNVSGQQKRDPHKVNYRVLDMTYSAVHKCLVLLDKKSAHYCDLDSMTERWRFDIPKTKDKDYNQLSCATLYKGFLLVLYETRGKLKFCIAELSMAGFIQRTAFSDVTSSAQYLKPHGHLIIKTDSKHNIYLINKEKGKIVIINAKCKFRPVLSIPKGSTASAPMLPEPGIFVTIDRKVGYVESKVDGTFAFYWINTPNEVVHLTENFEQIICVGHSGVHVYNKYHLFAQGGAASKLASLYPRCPKPQGQAFSKF